MSIQKLGPERWLIRWLEGAKPNHVHRGKTVRGSYADAARELKIRTAEAAVRRRPRQRLRLHDLADRYVAVRGPGFAPRWRQRVEQVLRDYLLPAFGSRVAEDLTAGAVIGYRHDRLATIQEKAAQPAHGVNRTINLEVAILNAVLNHAEGEGLISRNPIPRKRVPRLPERRVEIAFTPEEWKALRTAFDDPTCWRAHLATVRRLGPVTEDLSTGKKRRHGGGRKPDSPASDAYRERLRRSLDVLEAILLTGSRLGEILGLTWDAVDTRAGVVHIWQPKTGREKVLPLTDPLRALFARQIRGVGKTPVFQRPAKGAWDKSKVEYSYRLARKLARLRPELRIHDLRHAAATWLIQAGTSERVVRDYLGHTAISMTARYTHLGAEDLAEAARTLAEKASLVARKVARRGKTGGADRA